MGQATNNNFDNIADPRLTPLYPVPLPPIVAMKSVLSVALAGSARPKKKPLLCWKVLKVMPDFASVYGAAVWAAASEASAPVNRVKVFMMARRLLELEID